MKPILFSTPMVQAILDGRKTQTRRVINDTDCAAFLGFVHTDTIVAKQRPDKIGYAGFEDSRGEFFKKPIAQIGDILYVRETYSDTAINNRTIYKADTGIDILRYRWKPSLFMPKTYARLFLKVTNIRVEKLQDISEEDAIAEGIIKQTKDGEVFKYCVLDKKDFSSTPWQDMRRNAIEAYADLWNSIHKEPKIIVKQRRKDYIAGDKNALKTGHRWEANPYVFVYEFERVEKPEVNQ